MIKPGGECCSVHIANDYRAKLSRYKLSDIEISERYSEIMHSVINDFSFAKCAIYDETPKDAH